MVRRLYVLAALVAVGAACGGCACSVSCSKSACGSSCGSDYAFMTYDACCETCGPGCGNGCAGGCGEQVSCGDSCGGGACGGGQVGGSKCGHKARWFGSLFNCAGCGERYWNEWYNDPPSCAEPCDCCGNWIGPGHECSCCSRKPYCCGPYAGRHGGPGYIGAAPAPPLQLSENPGAITAEMLEK